MFEREIERYNTLLKEYRATVIDRFNVEDLKEYNEILFSALAAQLRAIPSP